MREGSVRVGYLGNVKAATIMDSDEKAFSALVCYFYTDEGTWFKSYYRFDPYFYIELHAEYKEEFLGFLDKNYKPFFKSIEEVKKFNLERIEHMTGQKTVYYKISFDTTNVGLALQRTWSHCAKSCSLSTSELRNKKWSQICKIFSRAFWTSESTTSCTARVS